MERVIIAGGSGMIGMRLKSFLEVEGFKVFVLTRDREKADSHQDFIYWNVLSEEVSPIYETADHVINLSGVGIADGRWTTSRKNEIIQSRVQSMGLLIDEAQRKSMRLKSFVSASAIGFYGDSGNTLLSEDMPVINDEFLSQVCVLWEGEASRAQAICEQLSIVRIGIVLSSSGGALEKMSKSIPLGVATYLGDGQQNMSWIHIDDLCKIFVHLIKKKVKGTFNAVAPEVLTNKEFTNILRSKINTKALLVQVPAFALKLALGEMSRVVLNSNNVSSEKIRSTGFQFTYPKLEKALFDIYGP